MTETNATTTSIEVMWRPGCPFCASLRRGLRRAGVATLEHDIWSSADAAARVRAVTGGDETVPTVFIGDQALVNPSVRQVVAAIRAVDPEHQPDPPAAAAHRGGNARVSPGLTWTLVVALVWSVLVAWRPTTTWHLAPLILAAAWPWVVSQDTISGDPSARRRIMLAGGSGLAAALALTGLLSSAGRLEGATWTGSGDSIVEALLLSAGGAAIATTLGLLRTVRRTTRRSAAPQQHHQRLPLEGDRDR
ncbi:Glutaredoxin [Nocardioides dokdonensis FR1436]|uniref:Glutaredoxin n=1 Tax=Nocardioides dokdonensis FR1436 TaxID=1300347 RepID=A0A1A9GPL6_9ACTN|nr:glutaredoxin domain-containing protein [Nocardioides dokdonensis]ANH39602.1 Glutaredoxin [Nocardioides dokdonensis FR1436]